MGIQNLSYSMFIVFGFLLPKVLPNFTPSILAFAIPALVILALWPKSDSCNKAENLLSLRKTEVNLSRKL